MTLDSLSRLSSSDLADLLVAGPPEYQGVVRRLLRDRSDEDAQTARLLREQPSDKRVRLLRASSGHLGPMAAAEAVKLLEDVDPPTRSAAANALGLAHYGPALSPLSERLNDPDAGVREQAIWALGQLADPGAVSPLAQVLADPSPVFRRRAVDALGRIGPASSDALVQAARDEAEEVRRAAESALARIREQSILDETYEIGRPEEALLRTWYQDPTLNPGSESYSFFADGTGLAEDVSLGIVRDHAEFDYVVEPSDGFIRFRFRGRPEVETRFEIEKGQFDDPAEGRLASLRLTLDPEPYFEPGAGVTPAHYYSLLP